MESPRSYAPATEAAVGYLHIDNLYQRAEVLQCFALEKIHGTSAHLGYRSGQLRYSAGGEKHARFVACIPVSAVTLAERFGAAFGPERAVVVYGEAFGGKQQGMGEVYGPTLRFVAFDVKVDGVWQDVPAAEQLVRTLGLEFVPYERGPLTLEWLTEQRDRPSLVAVVPGAKREGIVVRPIREWADADGGRMIFKYKTEDFRETRTPRAVTPEQLAILTDAGAIADEWVVPMRLEHVLQRTPYRTPGDTESVVRAMVADVRRESAGEVAWSKEVEKAIGRATLKLLQTLPTT